MFKTLVFSLAVLGLAGCGEDTVPVKGLVMLDGNPVEGATVTFGTEDGKRSYGGFTDSNGSFFLSGGGVPGALPGTYKVTVTKAKKADGPEGMAAGGDDYFRQMIKMSRESKASPRGPGGMVAGNGAVAVPKSELPGVYATMKTSTLNATVQSKTLSVTLDLKSR